MERSIPPNGRKVGRSCFICLQRFTKDDVTGQHSLWSISNYVKAFNEGKNSSKISRSKELCSECVVSIQKFNRFFLILEETRLRLNNSIKEIVAVMKEADEDIQTSQSDASIVDQSLQLQRAEFLNKCLRKLSFGSPSLVLKRVKYNPRIIKSEVIQDDEMNFDSGPLLDEDDQLSLDGSNTSCDNNNPSPKKSDTPPHESWHGPYTISGVVKEEFDSRPHSGTFSDCSYDDLEASNSSPSTAVAEDSAKSDSNSNQPAVSAEMPVEVPSTDKAFVTNDILKCPYCNKLYHQLQFNQHCMILHREHFVLEYKLDSVTYPQFKDIANHILFANLLKLGNKCTICGESWKSDRYGERLSLIRHTRRVHADHLRTRIIELQNDPDVPERVRKIMDESKKAEGQTCDLCGIVLSLKTSMRNHKRNSCRASKQRREDVECEKCNRWMTARHIHKHRRLCKGRKRSYFTSPRLTTVKCTMCGESLPFADWMLHKSKCRLAAEKKSGLPQAEPEMQMNSISILALTCDKCNKQFTRPYHLLHHKKRACTGRPKLVKARCDDAPKDLPRTNIEAPFEDVPCENAGK